MSGWSGWNGPEGYGAEGSGPEHGPGAERGPGEERGRAAWTADEPSAPPPWASAQTQSAALPSPPPWASAETGTAPVPPPPPPPWTAAPARTDGPFPSSAYVPAPRRVHGGRLVALVVAMALVGAGSGFGVWYLGRDRSGGGTPSASAPAAGVTVSASASASPSTTPRTAASTPPPAARQLPVGYRLVHDPVGYTLAVPEGWTRRQKQGEKATVVFYDSPSDGRQLQIFELAESTVTESLDLAENDPGYGYSREPGYQALTRSSGDSWAELSYRYDDPDKGARRVVDHRFRTADGTLYAIRSSGPERLSDARVRAPLTTALGSFCPTGLSCP
ncbi:hypothetical protein [Streptomyces sp. NPDC101165]|uniref:hypothetical protein n=1 Tax=Streptomyces sp. NPDC101165 TaxID=3366119 RepID=UPI003806BBDB